MFLLAIPLINAASILVDAPAQIIEAESVNANFTINSTMGFDGTVNLSYVNINSTVISVSFTQSSFSGEFYTHSWSVKGAVPGGYSIFANLVDSSGQTLAVFNKTGIVNSSMPRITFSSPSGMLSKDYTLLIAKTNEKATCKYDTIDNTYQNMSNTFTNTGSFDHNQTVSGLDQREHMYYVKCQDVNGYTMNESGIIIFTVDLPPSAVITLSDDSPVKAGTIEITVTVSENLENEPTLEYSFNDAPSSKQLISLTGSGSLWKGYLIFTEEQHNKIGTFYFRGIDKVGNVGTKIISGNIFIIDAVKPSPPQSIKVIAESDGSIKLVWYYDGEEGDYFKIYRSTNAGVNYADFYEKSNGSQYYLDTATIDKVTYYYRISTIDKAGNEGPLSEEIFATSVNKLAVNTTIATKHEPEVPKVLPPNLVPRVDIFIKKIDKLLIDVKDTSNQLEEKQGEKRELIKELKLIEQVTSAKSKLDSLKEQLEGFKAAYATEQELEQKLNAVDLEAKKIEKTTPKDADIIEKSDFLQSTSKEDIENAVNELFKDISITQDEKNAYIKKNEKEKDKIMVDVAVRIVSKTFLDGTKEEKSLIKKRLSYQNPETLNDVVVVETIPKAIAENVNEIEFSQKYEVIKEDTVVKFGFLKFNFEGEEIAYSLNKKINVEEVKNAKSVVLLSPNELVKISNKVTGSSIFALSSLGLSKTQAIFVWFGMITIIGLGGYYLLFVKDYKYLLKKLNRTLKMKRIERSLNVESDLPELPSLPSKNLSFADSLRVSDEDANKLLNELYLHINDVKADLADKLLPLFVTLNSKLESKGFKNKLRNIENNNIVFLNALIDESHKHLDSNLYSEAVKLYPKICFIYQNLPKESRTEVYEQCAGLLRRINNLKPIF